MKTADRFGIASTKSRPHLPKLAAATLLFLGLSTNTQLDAATSWPSLIAAPQPIANTNPAPPAPVASLPDLPPADASHVLSPQDADLYRAAFAAQEKADWRNADEALAKIKDQRLAGHVLADRYLRRPMTLAEAQTWLASYADLPEAAAIYAGARRLPGTKTASLPPPVVAASWTGMNDFGNSSGFRSALENDDDAQATHVSNKINALLRRGDPMQARDLLSDELKHGEISTADAGEITSHIAAAFFYQGQIERARPMAHLAAEVGTPLGLWIDGLSAWKQKDFDSATRSFASLAQAPGLSPWDRAAASYWAYRAAKRTKDEAQARHWLAETVKYPHSFYGTLAASISGHAAVRSWSLPELTDRNLATLAAHPAGWQALALMQIGKNALAESELRRLNPASREMQTAVLALAEKARMPSLSLQMGGLATNEGGQIYEAALYPLPPWQPANGFKIDRALLFALMKRESQFDPAAVSQSGACGLMQIMPNTAHLISHENKAGRRCPDRLFDPATNMELGQKYVRVLAGSPMIGNNLVLLLAAYNGGPGNLAHWLDGEDRSDPLLFLESLPMRETHDYVQQVLMHYWMYRSRLAEPETSVAQLARGEWPRYALNDNGITIVRRVATNGLELASVTPVRLNSTK
jgi:soluble lytic murein transglycosylase-like protein